MSTKIPQQGRDTVALLPTDTGAEISGKLHDYLAELQEAFAENDREARASGDADSPTYAPTGFAVISAAYVDSDSAGNIFLTLNAGLVEFLSLLPGYGFQMIDVCERRNYGFTDEDDESPFGYTIGALYRVKVGPVKYNDVLERESGNEWRKSKAKFDSGDLPTRNPGPSLEALLSQLRA